MNKTLVLIPVAWKPTNTIYASYNNLPDCMIPINSNPVIGHILDDLIERSFNDVMILLNKKDIYTEKYVSIRYKNKLNIMYKYIRNNNNWIIWTIREWINNINMNNYNSVFIYLWDTIYKWKLNFNKSFITVKKKFTDSSKWCFVEECKWNLKFINKPLEYNWNWKILTWLYYFKNIKKFKKIIEETKKWELYKILDRYDKIDNLTLINSERWYDIWNIENYYQAKIDFLKLRSFNRIKYNSTYWTIIKTSSNNEKINREINWYLNMPYELKIFAPRLVNYNYWKVSSYEIEYYWYQSLWDLFLFWYLNNTIWYNIIDNLFEKINLFKTYKTNQPYSFFYEMYHNKTFRRINEIKKNIFFNKLLNKKTVIINWKKNNNINYYIKNIDNYIKNFYDKEDIAFIHWDFCLSNILYDISSKILKMIDPRGFFWEIWVYWDIKYDVAKLRHSIVDYYDFIVSDLFKVEENDWWFKFEIYVDEIHKKISSYFDNTLKNNNFNLDTIKYIEALLFLTMIPLHSDNFERQKAMYLNSVLIFNSINLDKLWK